MAEILIGNIKGPQGIQGEAGTGIKVLDYYTTVDELTAAITNPSVGDAYGVGSAYPYDIYIYSPSQGWVNNGALQGAKGEQGPQGIQGEKGEPGADGFDGVNAIITDVTATVDNTTGTPTVSVTMGGTESERRFAFSFSGLKGEKGEQGVQGEKGEKGEAGANGVNVDINEQTPTYTEATTLETLTSGEKISSVFGKIKKAITDLIAHLADTTKHITSDERTAWTNKAATLHASTGTAYGVGNETNYGHLKVTDSLTSTESGTAASAKAIKSVADTVSSLMTSVASLQDADAEAGIQIVSSSYVGTGTYVNGQETPTNIAAGQNKLTFPAFPRVVFIKKRSSYRVNAIIMPNPTTNEVSFVTYGDNKWYQGRCSGKVESDNSLTWYALTQVWKYKADLTTGDVSVELEKLATESYNLKAYGQLNESSVTYDYVAICY